MKESVPVAADSFLNHIAPRKAKIVYNFVLPECSRVNKGRPPLGKVVWSGEATGRHKSCLSLKIHRGVPTFLRHGTRPRGYKIFSWSTQLSVKF